MKVLNRKQITKVITERMIFHDVVVNGITYRRTVRIKIDVPYMDTEIVVSKPKISWSMYINHNTIQDLTVKEVIALELNEQFDLLDIDSKNGNI